MVQFQYRQFYKHLEVEVLMAFQLEVLEVIFYQELQLKLVLYTKEDLETFLLSYLRISQKEE